MRILRVSANNHRRVFVVTTRKGSLVFPHGLAKPAPTRGNGVRRVFVDPELGREAFTYELESGAQGSVHLDSVLDYNADPAHLADLLLHRLTIEARKGIQASPVSLREIARRLGTSPAQIYRLLDPTNRAKSANQLVALLHVLGYEVDVDVRRARRRGKIAG